MQVGRKAGRLASRQACRQAVRQAGSNDRQLSKQASTRKAFSWSHALEGLVSRKPCIKIELAYREQVKKSTKIRAEIFID